MEHGRSNGLGTPRAKWRAFARRGARRINQSIGARFGVSVTRVRNNQSTDHEFDEIFRRVRPFTMTSERKLRALVDAARYVVDNGIEGSLVECGVWRGGSMQAAALALRGRGDVSRDLYLFDTFEGMTAPTDRDVQFDGQKALDRLAARARHESTVWAYASLAEVKGGFEGIEYPSEKIHFVKGPVEQTLPEQAPERVALLRLDTDWYESTRHELETLYERLVPGGVLILDDYEWWRGARSAVDEFLKDRRGILLHPMDEGRIGVKFE